MTTKTFTEKIVLLCNQGELAQIEALLRDRLSEFDADTFTEHMFAFQQMLMTHTSGSPACKRDWSYVPVCPPPAQYITDAVAFVLKTCADLFTPETASLVLTYSCSDHHRLIPTVLEIFKGKLHIDSVTDGIYACEKRYTPSCFLIMENCADRLTGWHLRMCFEICCDKSNTCMLEKLIGYHPIAVKTIAQASRNSFLSSNDGITACCKCESTKLVQMLIDHDSSLGPRILWLSISYITTQLSS